MSARAQIVRRTPLGYHRGADPRADRPAHVRAASGLARWRDQLVVVQDDALFLALLDPATGRCDDVALPSADGVRTFDTRRGNKAAKPDLESVVVVDGEVLAFGSGSSPRREQILRWSGGEPRWWPAQAFYAQLRATTPFAGAELNVEGAAVWRDHLWLFNRGNGAATPDTPAVDAVARLPLAAVRQWLAGGAPPPLTEVVPTDLGELDGVRLTFTDADADADGLVCLAAAEASPNAIDDGAVMGSAIGRWRPTGTVWARLWEGDTPTRDKAEGLAVDPTRPGHAWVVVDPDDPDRPAELLDVVFPV